MAPPIVTKFGVCLETKQQCILHRSWVGYICTYTRTHVQMCPFSASGYGQIALQFGVWLDTFRKGIHVHDGTAIRWVGVPGAFVG